MEVSYEQRQYHYHRRFEIPYEFEIGHGMDHGFGEALFSELRGWIERSVAFMNKIEGVAERK